VWVDALTNYVSAIRHLRPAEFDHYWPHAEHLIGKDILKAHGVFWPTMLMSAGLPLFQGLHVHGYWNFGESKMSKSLGNVIRPLEMKQRFGMDAFRYFLLREMAFGQDASFSEDAFITRVNADLANNLGNLVSRTLAMQQRYFAGVVQPLGSPADDDRALAEAFRGARRVVAAFTAQLAFHRALEALWRDRPRQQVRGHDIAVHPGEGSGNQAARRGGAAQPAGGSLRHGGAAAAVPARERRPDPGDARSGAGYDAGGRLGMGHGARRRARHPQTGNIVPAYRNIMWSAAASRRTPNPL
jgi:hypothetical protein